MRSSIFLAGLFLLLCFSTSCDEGKQGHHEEKTLTQEEIALQNSNQAKAILNDYLAAVLAHDKANMDSLTTQGSHTYNNILDVYLKKFEGKYDKKPEALQYYIASSKQIATDTISLLLRVSLENQSKEDSFVVVKQEPNWKLKLHKQNINLLNFMTFYGKYNELYKKMLNINQGVIQIDSEKLKKHVQDIKIDAKTLQDVKNKPLEK